MFEPCTLEPNGNKANLNGVGGQMFSPQDDLPLGSLIFYFMREAGYDQTEMSKQLDMDSTTMSRVISGERFPDHDQLIAISKVCRLSRSQQTALLRAGDYYPQGGEWQEVLSISWPQLNRFAWPVALMTYRYEVVACNPRWQEQFAPRDEQTLTSRFSPSPTAGMPETLTTWLQLLFDPRAGVRRWLERQGIWENIARQQLTDVHRSTRQFRSKARGERAFGPDWRQAWVPEYSNLPAPGGEQFQRLWAESEEAFHKAAVVYQPGVGPVSMGVYADYLATVGPIAQLAALSEPHPPTRLDQGQPPIINLLIDRRPLEFDARYSVLLILEAGERI